MTAEEAAQNLAAGEIMFDPVADVLGGIFQRVVENVADAISKSMVVPAIDCARAGQHGAAAEKIAEAVDVAGVMSRVLAPYHPAVQVPVTQEPAADPATGEGDPSGGTP